MFPHPNSIVKIALTGSRDSDFTAAFRKSGINRNGAIGYTWHHVADFNPVTGHSTFQLVKTNTHVMSLPHLGSVSQFEKYFQVEYDTYEAKMVAYMKGWRETAPQHRKQKTTC